MLQFGPFLGQKLQNVNSFGGLDQKYSTILETRASYYQTRTKRLFLHNQSQSVLRPITHPMLLLMPYRDGVDTSCQFFTGNWR